MPNFVSKLKIDGINADIKDASLTAALSTEITNREAADTALQNADAALQNAIDAEAQARESADEALSDQIESLINQDSEPFINLTVNRYGTGIIKDTDDDFSGVQGMCMLDETTAAVYFADYNNSTQNGHLRKMNVRSGIISDDVYLEGAGHGQTVCYDGTFIYILYFTGGSTAVNAQKVTIVRASTWVKIGTYTIEFTGTPYFVSAISYDRTDSTLKCIIEPSVSQTLVVATATYENSRFIVNSANTLTLEFPMSGEFLSGNSHNNGTSYIFTRDYIFTLTNEPQSIVVWDKTDGHYVKCMSIGPLFADDFWMGESEAMDILPDGTAILAFMAIANRSVWADGSGWYMHSFGYTNVFHNIVPWTPYNGIQWDAGFRASFHTDPNYDHYDGDGTAAKPMQSVYIPMLYKPKFGGFNIYVDADETIKNLSFVNREDIALYGYNRLTVQNATHVKYSRNIIISGLIGTQDLIIEQSDVRVMDGKYRDISLTDSILTTILNDNNIRNMICDLESDVIAPGGGLNYNKLTARIPAHLPWYKTAPNVDITSNGISTGVDRSKLGTLNDELWIAINTNNKYIRVPFIGNTGEMYVAWVYGSSSGVADIAVTNNIIYLKALTEGNNNILSTVTSITVYSTK